MTVQSLFAQLLIAIQARMEEAVPEIKWCDQDLGQLEEDIERPRVQWPCVLVDFLDTTYDELQQATQMAAANVQLRLGFSPYSSATAATPMQWREEALNYYELEDKLYQAFQYWEAGGLIQPMTRTSGVTEKREDLFRVRKMIFTTTFQDESAKPAKLSVSRPLIQLQLI
jgi:hypothetical protein